MTAKRMLRVLAAAVGGALLAGANCMTSVTFVTPERAESTETRVYTLPANAGIQIGNDIGSTRVTVDANATQATLSITRIALANSQADADALLTRMAVNVTEPTAADNTLIIDAVRPPQATDDEQSFQATVTDDEINIVAILGSVEVVQFKLELTLPPGHGVAALQGVGRVRLVGLDTASTAATDAGSVRSIGGTGPLAATTQAGRIAIESHRGSLDLDTQAGAVDIEILALAADDTVVVRTQVGNIDLRLPADVPADLRALVELGNITFRERDFDAVTGLTTTHAFVEATLNGGGAAIDLRSELGLIGIDSF